MAACRAGYTVLTNAPQDASAKPASRTDAHAQASASSRNAAASSESTWTMRLFTEPLAWTAKIRRHYQSHCTQAHMPADALRLLVQIANSRRRLPADRACSGEDPESQLST
jgi:hypothetical protein